MFDGHELPNIITIFGRYILTTYLLHAPTIYHSEKLYEIVLHARYRKLLQIFNFPVNNFEKNDLCIERS